MNARPNLAEAEPVSEPTELAIIPRETALSVLTDPEQFDAFYSKVKGIVDAHVPDVSTPKGREAIKALAFKVVKSKTAIDAAGKLLTEEWRSQTAKVDAARKAIRDKLDVLRDEARRPVTEWEAEEEARVDRVKVALADLQSAAVIAIGDTSDTLDARLAQVQAIQIEDTEFQEYAAAARAHRQAAIEALTAGIERLAKEEADRAELQRLRDEQAQREQAERDRQQREAEERAAAEQLAARKAREEAEAEAEIERQRIAAAQAEAARIAKGIADAAAIEAENARRDAAAARAETERLQKAESDRIAKEQAEKAAEEKREANKAHKGRIMAAAKKAIMDLNIDEETAKRVVLAIAADAIPNVSIRF